MDVIYLYLILEVSDVYKVLSKICFIRVFYYVLLKAYCSAGEMFESAGDIRLDFQ